MIEHVEDEVSGFRSTVVPMLATHRVDEPPARSVQPVFVGGPALTVLAGLAVVFALQWARPVLVPLLFGILISYALDPLVRQLVGWRVPHPVAASVVFVTAFALVGGLGYSLSHQLTVVADRLPGAAQDLRQAVQARLGDRPGPVAKLQQAANELQKLSGSDAPPPGAARRVPTVALERKPFDLGDYLWQSSLSVTSFIGDTIVASFLALYLLLAGDTFRRRIVEIAGPTLSRKKITVHILDAIGMQISRYLFLRAVICAFVAAGTFVAFWAIGLEQPGVWSIAAGLLNVIPYVGPGVVTAGAALAAFMQFHTFSMAAIAGALATAVACVEAYAITPWLMSRTAEMNPAAVFVALVFWGWLWGLPGLFLAVPLVMVIKSVSDHIDALQPVATLLKR